MSKPRKPRKRPKLTSSRYYKSEPALFGSDDSPENLLELARRVLAYDHVHGGGRNQRVRVIRDEDMLQEAVILLLQCPRDGTRYERDAVAYCRQRLAQGALIKEWQRRRLERPGGLLLDNVREPSYEQEWPAIDDGLDAKEFVRRLLLTIPARQAEVVRMRLSGMTLEQIAVKIKLTRERVRQIELNGLRKLAKHAHELEHRPNQTNTQAPEAVLKLIERLYPPAPQPTTPGPVITVWSSAHMIPGPPPPPPPTFRLALDLGRRSRPRWQQLLQLDPIHFPLQRVPTINVSFGPPPTGLRRPTRPDNIQLLLPLDKPKYPALSALIRGERRVPPRLMASLNALDGLDRFQPPQPPPPPAWITVLQRNGKTQLMLSEEMAERAKVSQLRHYAISYSASTRRFLFRPCANLPSTASKLPTNLLVIQPRRYSLNAQHEYCFWINRLLEYHSIQLPIGSYRLLPVSNNYDHGFDLELDRSIDPREVT